MTIDRGFLGVSSLAGGREVCTFCRHHRWHDFATLPRYTYLLHVTVGRGARWFFGGSASLEEVYTTSRPPKNRF